MATRPLAGAHAGRDKKLIFGQMATNNNAKKIAMSRQRLSHSSPLGRPIHFGEGLAETGQARQRLGVSCDVLSTYQSGPDARYWAQTRRSLSTVFIILGPPMWSAASCSNRYEACRTALSSQFGLQTLNQYIAVSAGST